MQKLAPGKEKAETDFGRVSLNWKAKTNTEGGSACTSTVQGLSTTCVFAEKVDGRKPAAGGRARAAWGQNSLAAEVQLVKISGASS